MRVYESICISMFVRFPKFCFSSSSAFERKKREREEKNLSKSISHHHNNNNDTLFNITLKTCHLELLGHTNNQL